MENMQHTGQAPHSTHGRELPEQPRETTQTSVIHKCFDLLHLSTHHQFVTITNHSHITINTHQIPVFLAVTLVTSPNTHIPINNYQIRMFLVNASAVHLISRSISLRCTVRIDHTQVLTITAIRPHEPMGAVR